MSPPQPPNLTFSVGYLTVPCLDLTYCLVAQFAYWTSSILPVFKWGSFHYTSYFRVVSNFSGIILSDFLLRNTSACFHLIPYNVLLLCSSRDNKLGQLPNSYLIHWTHVYSVSFINDLYFLKRIDLPRLTDTSLGRYTHVKELFPWSSFSSLITLGCSYLETQFPYFSELNSQ